MSAVKDGGRAFPRPYAQGSLSQTGMSLRAWIAGQALPSVMIQCANDTRRDGQTHEQMFAEKSIAVADAMIAELAKGGAQ